MYVGNRCFVRVWLLYGLLCICLAPTVLSGATLRVFGIGAPSGCSYNFFVVKRATDGVALASGQNWADGNPQVLSVSAPYPGTSVYILQPSGGSCGIVQFTTGRVFLSDPVYAGGPGAVNGILNMDFGNLGQPPWATDVGDVEKPTITLSNYNSLIWEDGTGLALESTQKAQTELLYDVLYAGFNSMLFVDNQIAEHLSGIHSEVIGIHEDTSANLPGMKTSLTSIDGKLTGVSSSVASSAAGTYSISNSAVSMDGKLTGVKESVASSAAGTYSISNSAVSLVVQGNMSTNTLAWMTNNWFKTNGLVEPDVGSQSSAGSAAGAAGKAGLDGSAATFVAPAGVSGAAGDWTVSISRFGVGAALTANLDPLANASLASIAAMCRALVSWVAVALFVGFVCSHAGSYVRALPAARQAQAAGTAIWGFNLNTVVALLVAVAMTTALATVPVFVTSYLLTGGYGALLSSNPLSAYGGGVTGMAIYLADAFLPLTLLFGLMVSGVAFRLSVAGVFWLSTTIVRFIVGCLVLGCFGQGVEGRQIEVRVWNATGDTNIAPFIMGRDSPGDNTYKCLKFPRLGDGGNVGYYEGRVDLDVGDNGFRLYHGNWVSNAVYGGSYVQENTKTNYNGRVLCLVYRTDGVGAPGVYAWAADLWWEQPPLWWVEKGWAWGLVICGFGLVLAVVRGIQGSGRDI